MQVLICGAGVVGAAIAYFLSRRGVTSIIIERTTVACAASGKSGGFLALDWCDGTPLAPLARRSFALHARLSGELDGDWGYRRLTTFGAVARAQMADPGGPDSGLAWLSPVVRISQRLGSPASTAQVHPGQFTSAMMRDAIRRGSQLRIGRIREVVRTADGTRVRGVIVDDRLIEGDAIVIAMGPWSGEAAAWLSLPPLFGLKGHSVLFATGTRIPAEAVFLDYQDLSGALISPEIFPRPDGTTYICGFSSETPLPDDPAGVQPDRGAIERLEALCYELAPVLRDSQVLARQACYRPVTRDGLPLIGAVPGLAGAYVATGHSVWGILNAPATGEAIANLIVDGSPGAVELSAFDPGRFSGARGVGQRGSRFAREEWSD
jgi:glycine/D-amino acid oxidase-like deaminating enzyme